jgi:predicted nucleic acid-binding protein
MPRALRIAGERNITTSDAQFLELPQDRGAPLITHDGRLLRAVPDLALTARQHLERVRR